MALLEDLVCSECGEQFKGVVTRNYGALCDKCAETKENEEKERWLEEFRGKNSLEERVARIEEWIFEHQEMSGQVPWDGPV